MDSTKKEDNSEISAFSLNSENVVFSSRIDDVFGNLGVIEQKHSAFVKSQPDEESNIFMKDDPDDSHDTEISKRSNQSQWSKSSDYLPRSSNYSSRSGISDSRDQESRSRSTSLERRHSLNSRDSHKHNREPRDSFRTPRGTPPKPRHRGVPDYKKNPERWTCYSLDDVHENDMSERTNKRAALAFLEERRKEREKQERLAEGLPEEDVKFDVGYGACSQGRITFNRSKGKTKINNIEMSSDELAKKNEDQNTLGLSVGSANEHDENYVNEQVTNISEKGDKPKSDIRFKPKKQVKRSIRKRDCGSDDSD